MRFYTENYYKTLLREITKDQNKCRLPTVTNGRT